MKGGMSSRMTGREGGETVTIVTAGGIVLALSFGVRAVFGGVVQPLSDDLFMGRIEIFSLSIAIQNLVWGLAQPGFGMIADRFGDRRALWLGFFCYLFGMAVCITGSTPFAQHMGAGVLVGMGISGTAFGTVLAVVGRAAPPEKRGFYLGIASAMGSAGQALVPLLASWLIASLDWRMTLVVVTVMLAPMALCIPFLRVGAQTAPTAGLIDLRQTVRHAFGHGSFVMLSAGFFVCGFHLAFITAHLPTYVQNFCVGTSLSPDELRALGLRALALAGFANIFGTLLAARLGSLFPKPYVLAAIYALRAAIILGFISLPVTPTSVMIFGLLVGGLWLSTVPLTSALVLVMFGPRAMGTLFGFVFLSHQLGGFAGVWLGGVWFDQFDSYEGVWLIAVVLGLLSALIHLTVRERAALATV
ncbi:MFS transporter [Rhodovibrio salinarum]|uniref:MFS transporter n=2 Tax=Rhodovibrio salinarum TaxID=1087 RepID=A0A934QGJ7_9PROT|nr:MFS transporter [Rhodovibrio salinarum]